jgi:Xaa-Pro aminopeptidase
MKYLPINPELFIHNRRNLAAEMKANSIAVLNSNDIMPTSADGTLPFRQQSDLFYLSGIDQEDSILVLYPDALEARHREVLFLRETSEEIAIWEGHKYTVEEARQVSGVQTVYWLSQFEKIFNNLMVQAEYRLPQHQ